MKRRGLLAALASLAVASLWRSREGDRRASRELRVTAVDHRTGTITFSDSLGHADTLWVVGDPWMPEIGDVVVSA